MNYEPFSKSTFRGVASLGVVLILVFVLPDIVRFFSTEESLSIQFLDREKEKKINTVDRFGRKPYNRYKKESRYQVPPEKFNPNDYTQEEWMALGLSPKQAAVIVKWTKRKLKSNEDLKRIFVISDELFALIKDSTFYDALPIIIAEQKFPTEKIAPKVQLNTATVEDLMEVKGIGPFYAKQIIKKRDELGGFVRIEQLLEVWKVDEEKLSLWTNSFIVNPEKVRKLNINTATAEELKSHPYISWNLANSIVKLRLQIGSFKKVEDVKKSVLMTNEIYDKLKYYLTIGE